MSPSDLANVFSFLNTVLLISDMLKHVFSLYLDQDYLGENAAVCGGLLPSAV